MALSVLPITSFMMLCQQGSYYLWHAKHSPFFKDQESELESSVYEKHQLQDSDLKCMKKFANFV